MLLAIPFPQFNPVAFSIGPLDIRWYALAYIAAMIIGWRYCLALSNHQPRLIARQHIDDFLVWATLGVVLGGRLGYVLFYKPGYYFTHPLEIPAMWTGGMSFHGGCIGVVIALWLFTRERKISILALADIVACAVPIGLFFGRIANFVNGELYGRVAPPDLAWAMIFPSGGPAPRYPSQLIQASLEGVALFGVVTIANLAGARQKPGIVTGYFLIGYALARIIGEVFREPDSFLGFVLTGTLGEWLTMGQLLSTPMILGGLYLILRAKRAPGAAMA